MSAADTVARAIRAWVDGRRTGFLILNFRHGELKYLEHQEREHLPSARRADGPACPKCGEGLLPRDQGAIWACPACGLKRTKAQMEGGEPG